MSFNDEQLLRYNRQILLPEIDIQGQQQLADSTVVIIGMGGLGCPAAQYLCSAGVGHLVLCDGDTVELSNLQRQILYTEQQLGVAKVDAAAQRLHAINSDVKITTVPDFVTTETLPELIQSANLVLDCSDNISCRLAVNSACKVAKLPLVSASAIAWGGQQISFDFRDEASACYRCVYPAQDDQDLSCNDAGIMSPVVGLMGLNQALAAVRIITGLMAETDTQLSCFDGLQGQWHYFSVQKNSRCPVCGSH